MCHPLGMTHQLLPAFFIEPWQILKGQGARSVTMMRTQENDDPHRDKASGNVASVASFLK